MVASARTAIIARTAALAVFATLGVPPAAVAQTEAEAAAASVDDARLRAADSEPDQWMSHGRTWSEQRYSSLDQINTATVGGLGLAWNYETGTTRGMESTPLVIDGVMYATGAWSKVYALDAATGKELWTYDPKVPGAKARDACCDVVNRGVAAWKGRLYLGALDGRLICLDAATGKPLWEKQTTDPARAYTITGAPRVVKDKVIIGNGGAEFGVRGYFSAYDATSGDMLWRFYTVPASTQGPFENPELEIAAKTWSSRSMWDTGLGGTVWDSISYDPELDLLYVGVGNASGYNRELRSPGGGDNLFVASILAVDPDDGRMAWYYQTVPGESWDYTATQHMILADIEISGAPRKVLMQAPKNGFFYVLDRGTGELLSAEPYVAVSWATRVDKKTGRPVERPQAVWSQEPARVTPGIPGGHNWHPMAFSPQTGLVYIPTFESLYEYSPDQAFEWRRGYFNTGEDLDAVAAKVEGFEEFARYNTRTHLTAWDPVAGAQRWHVDLGQGIPAGVLATAGGLVFQGTTDGRLVAYDATGGATLWQTSTGTGIMAPPISYRIGNEQYVAVVAGLGGSQGGHFTRITNANRGRIVAFKLGGNAMMPVTEQKPVLAVEAPPMQASVETLARGRALYSSHCARCHGVGVVSSGLYPDLRYSSAGVHTIFPRIVGDGLMAERGMAPFSDVLGNDDIDAIHAYVTQRARHQTGWVEWLAAKLAGRLRIPASWLAN
ncbi:MAG: PQQ-dependent dehydrogenase, methanol/ethanol family [Deltaproteobacteria bacterium]|nr:PQQ-dependent dehydrogenase, methanol/ethanol family [Deltaproteobacteria bacterium]